MLNSLEKIIILAENSVVMEYYHIMEPFLLPVTLVVCIHSLCLNTARQA